MIKIGYCAIGNPGQAQAAQQLKAAGPVGDMEALLFEPPQAGPCVKVPCLYDLSKDPNEHHDRASEQPALVIELTQALHSAGSSGYPPVPGSDGTPTSDAECAMVNKSGSWQPWA
jgi:hypothetical protein